MKGKKILHIDSLRSNHADNPTSSSARNILFKEKEVTFESFFKERMQFDSNSCGIWLVAGFCSFLKRLPDIQEKCEAFDLCYNLLSIPTVYPLKKFGTNHSICTEEQFLINVLTKSPETSEYFRKVPQIAIRTKLASVDACVLCLFSGRILFGDYKVKTTQIPWKATKIF